MVQKKYTTEKRYSVDCILSNGHCYRTIYDCSYKQVKELRSLAKMLGETIKVEYLYTKKNEYRIFR